jgi:hypothetical protein
MSGLSPGLSGYIHLNVRGREGSLFNSVKPEAIFAYTLFLVTILPNKCKTIFNSPQMEYMEELELHNNEENPLKDLISDQIYTILKLNGLFNETSIRDRLIRKKYRVLRERNVSSGNAIDIIREEYPYLQFDTIKKIVHHSPGYRKKRTSYITNIEHFSNRYP